MIRKKNKKKKPPKKKLQSQNKLLNGIIGILGVFLIGFILSFSKNSSNSGVQIDIHFHKIENQPRLAVEVFEKNPILNMKVEVLNGCGVQGLAGKTAEYLRLNQIDVINSDDADHHDYPQTVIIQRNENIQSLKKVSESFGILPDDKSRIKIQPDETLGVDVTIILGKDYNTLPKFENFIKPK